MKLSGGKHSQHGKPAPAKKEVKPAKEKTAKEKKPKKSKAPGEQSGGGRGRVALIVVLALIAAILVGAAAGVNYISKINTIFPNVRVDGIDVGGLSLEETADRLT